MRRVLVPFLVLVLVLLAALPTRAGTRSRGGSGVWGDFNGDGFADLFVGVPFDTLAGKDDAGSVNVIYGSKRGTGPRGNQLWHQDRPNIRGAVAPGDIFGWAVGAGDFNGDGHDDLAVGIYNEEVNGVDEAGAVQVIYGGPKGLRARGNQLWHQGRAGIADQPEHFDHFGMRVAAGDVDGDGFDDLLVGVPNEDLRGASGAGAMHVIRGGPRGLRSNGSQFWHQGRAGIAGDIEPGEAFGFEIVAGQFGRGPQMDVAVSTPGDNIPAQSSAGAVHVLFGGRRGLTANGSQYWHRGKSAIPGEPAAFEGFGVALAAGNFGRGDRDDLAIGIYNDEVGGDNGAGSVAVLYGGPKGLRGKGVQLWHQDRGGIDDEAEQFDAFGLAVVAGDLGRSAHDDLAIGVPFEGLAGTSEGVVHVIFGATGGLRATGSQLWHQDSPGVSDVAENGDLFGLYLQAGNVGRGPKMDLAIGVPGESIGGALFAGAVNLLHGKRGGLTAKGNRLWHQDVPRIKGVAQTGDGFGVLNRFLD